ncbi:hypothetical protein, partial [Novosphingobium malaysiense]|uniref:hypothetical protein n=1 Tax=Novosphingobium malaysiense TaxID=1348853 RepID=UPI001E2B31AE
PPRCARNLAVRAMSAASLGNLPHEVRIDERLGLAAILGAPQQARGLAILVSLASAWFHRHLGDEE